MATEGDEEIAHEADHVIYIPPPSIASNHS